jgi:hypothetical protein
MFFRAIRHALRALLVAGMLLAPFVAVAGSSDRPDADPRSSIDEEQHDQSVGPQLEAAGASGNSMSTSDVRPVAYSAELVAIPDPGTVLLLGMGLGGLAFAGRPPPKGSLTSRSLR